MSRLKTRNRQLDNIRSNALVTIARIVILAFIVYILWMQNNYIATTKFVFADTDLPKSFVGYKILHISDICNTSNNVVNAAKKAEPDIIVISGGYLDKNGNHDKTINIVNSLCDIASVYYIYNVNDKDDILENTSAKSLVNGYVDISAEDMNLEAFISKAYGDGIINKANKGDEEAVQYMQYVKEELESTKYSKLRLCGMQNISSEFVDEIHDKAYELTGYNKEDLTIMINGNLENLDKLCDTNIDILLCGGTFGKSSDATSYTKGTYSKSGTQMFISGGCGTYDGFRISNLHEVQLITLSDGTITQSNPLKSLLERLIGDVETVYENDGGFEKRFYPYGRYVAE